MTNIDPHAVLATISVDDLDESDAARVLLPGAAGINSVTTKQQKVVLRWMRDNLSGSLSYADATAEARKRFLVGAQRDFGMVDKIIAEGRLTNAHNALSPDQDKMVNTIVAALSGKVPHWDPSIATAIKAADPEVRTALTTSVIKVATQGQLSQFMERFAALFGRPKQRVGIGGVISATTEPAPTSDSEPF